MKKQLLSAFTLITMLAQAQPSLTENSVFDDFSTAEELTVDVVTGRGVYWWATVGEQTIARDVVNKELNVDMIQRLGQYKPFGVGFGDDNGATAGGVPYTIDLSVDGKFSFDIENKGTEALSVRVACQDVNNRLVDCSPGALIFKDIWKYQTQILVPVGETVSFKAGTENGAGGGIINNCDFANGVWGDYGINPHIIRTDCDLTKIKGINITVLNAAKNDIDGHNLALTDGLFAISNFKVGGIGNAISEIENENKKFSVYPNPASQSVTVNNEFGDGVSNSVQIVNVFGQVVYSNNAIPKANGFVIETSAFQAGIYYVQVGNSTQKLIIK